VLLQRVADLPRRETKDARCLRLNPARLFHVFDERVFAELRKTIAITFTRRRNVRAVPISRPLGSARSCGDFAGTAGAELGGSLSRVCYAPKPYRPSRRSRVPSKEWTTGQPFEPAPTASHSPAILPRGDDGVVSIESSIRYALPVVIRVQKLQKIKGKGAEMPIFQARTIL